jgi:DNA-binding PadR family transcriptional regulator
MAERAKRLPDAVAEATLAGARAAGAARGRASDVFGGEIRRRDVIPLLVLHLMLDGPAYGNRLIEEIEKITEGGISVNPNTMYPLLRGMEANGLVEGRWEHPDRRSRRYYSITRAGRREHDRLLAEIEPFLDSVVRSIAGIQRALYARRRSAGRKARS